jgi:hypothetical protein
MMLSRRHAIASLGRSWGPYRDESPANVSQVNSRPVTAWDAVRNRRDVAFIDAAIAAARRVGIQRAAWNAGVDTATVRRWIEDAGQSL